MMNAGYAIQQLKGRTITGYEIADNGEWMHLHLDNGCTLELEAQGDCCSLSWVESIDAPDVLNGGAIIEAKDIDMPNLGNIDGARHTDVDCVSYYGLQITTNKGRCVIDYRNDSNGYYGGRLEVNSANLDSILSCA